MASQIVKSSQRGLCQWINLNVLANIVTMSHLLHWFPVSFSCRIVERIEINGGIGTKRAEQSSQMALSCIKWQIKTYVESPQISKMKSLATMANYFYPLTIVV